MIELSRKSDDGGPLTANLWSPTSCPSSAVCCPTATSCMTGEISDVDGDDVMVGSTYNFS